MKRLICFICAFLGMTALANAQSDDFGMWYELGAEMKLSQKWSLGLEGEFRTRNNTKTADRWSAGINAEYKILKGLKAAAGYMFLYDNNAEELTWKNSLPNKWTPSYWGSRHRLFLQLSGSLKAGNFNFSLRERWQYTYRPEVQDKKYNFKWDEDANDNAYISGYTMEPVKGKGKNALRSRLQINYDIPRCKFEPFANVEMFNDDGGIAKMRYQIGTDYKVKKRHVFSLTYRYQTVKSNDDDNEANCHMIGLGYKFKF